MLSGPGVDGQERAPIGSRIAASHPVALPALRSVQSLMIMLIAASARRAMTVAEPTLSSAISAAITSRSNRSASVRPGPLRTINRVGIDLISRCARGSSKATVQQEDQ